MKAIRQSLIIALTLVLAVSAYAATIMYSIEDGYFHENIWNSTVSATTGVGLNADDTPIISNNVTVTINDSTPTWGINASGSQGIHIGESGKNGTLNMIGGAINTVNFNIGRNNHSDIASATLNLSGGNLTVGRPEGITAAGTFYVGGSGSASNVTALLNITGGTLDTSRTGGNGLVVAGVNNSGRTGGNNGTIQVSGGNLVAGTINLASLGHVNITTLDEGTIKLSGGNLTNRGAFNIGGFGNGTLLVESGNLTAENALNIGTVVGASGAGNGAGAVEISGGMVSLKAVNIGGGSGVTGILTVKGDRATISADSLAIATTGSLAFVMGADGISRLTIIGEFDFGAGISNFSLDGSAYRGGSDTITLLSAGSLSGSTSSIITDLALEQILASAGFTSLYDVSQSSLAWIGNDLVLSITAIPEPATYAMIFAGIALAVVAWRRRR